MGDWGNIPTDIATIIAEHLLFLEDFEAFSFVCSRWRIGAKQANFRAKLCSSSSSTKSPWLMLPEPETTSNQRRLYSLYNHKVRTTNLPIPNHNNYSIRLLSSNGWLLSVINHGSKLCLVNPLSGATINLPKVRYWNHLHRGLSYYECHEQYYGKFILSGNPSSSSDDFAIALVLSEPVTNPHIRYETISFWKKSNDEWHPILRTDYHYPFIYFYSDIIFYKGNFYSVDDNGTIRCHELDHSGRPRYERLVINLDDVTLRQCRHEANYKLAYYLVESENRLLYICRVREKAKVDESYSEIHTVSFKVYEVNVDNEYELPVPDLGDVAIFVGSSSSFSTKASSDNGIKGNSIYFSDDYRDEHYRTFGLHNCKNRGVDMGIFSLADDSIYQLEIDWVEAGEVPADFRIPSPYFWLDGTCF